MCPMPTSKRGHRCRSCRWFFKATQMYPSRCLGPAITDARYWHRACGFWERKDGDSIPFWKTKAVMVAAATYE